MPKIRTKIGCRMPKIKVEIEVPDEYCDKNALCPAFYHDEWGYHCLIFDTYDDNLELDRQIFAHKRCEQCKQAEVKE